MLIPCDGVNILNSFRVMIILRLLLFLTNLHLKLLSTQGTGADRLLSTQRVKKFNKRKNRKEGWMTNELLTKVVKKNKLYVVWKTTPLTNENYEIYKARFKDHDKEVKKDILKQRKGTIIEFSILIEVT